MNPPVFFGAAACVVGFVIFGGVFTKTAGRTFEALQTFIVAHFGWFYILSTTGLLVFILWLVFSRYGAIRLGGNEAQPQFTYYTWFSMMLAAGMGIGVVFFGVAEPIQHWAHPPLADPRTPEALRQSMRFTFFHWGLHPWAIYSAIALPLAYFHFRHNLPLAPRSLLYPLIGRHIQGWAGHAVDILCTVGTLFGVATSLGLGAQQINSGLHHIFDLPESTTMRVALIAIITAIATVSVVTGLERGIRFLSEFNIGLAALILVFVFVAGPTIYCLELFVTGLGDYLQNLPLLSLWVQPAVEGMAETEGSIRSWQGNWTLFYWSWWISWSPFVGVFVARISRGRTIREFILAAMLVPTLMGFLWFSTIGGTALNQTISGVSDIPAVAEQNQSLALYAMLENLPLASVTTILATLLIVVFFVTSSDSGSFVDDMVTAGGHPDPPKAQRVFWALAEGSVAATLLIVGGLSALRTASLTTGLPMTVFLIVAAVGLARALRRDLAEEREVVAAHERAEVTLSGTEAE